MQPVVARPGFVCEHQVGRLCPQAADQICVVHGFRLEAEKGLLFAFVAHPGSLGVAAICGGGGQGAAIVLEGVEA